MPIIDQTGEYVNRGIGQITSILSQMTDPGRLAALHQARMERELFPLRRQSMEGEIGLRAAQTLTEGEQQNLLRARTSDQTTQTRFRNLMGSAFDSAGGVTQAPEVIPQVAPLLPIEPIAQQFNAAIAATPGASAALQGTPAAPTQVAPAATPQNIDGPAALRLLPPIGTPQQIAMWAAAASPNPNSEQLMSALSRAEALRGGVTEQRSRDLLLAQGVAPTVNTAVTPGWQGTILDNQSANAQALNDADNAAAMQRTIVSPAARAMFGGGGAGQQQPSYSDTRNMATDAGGLADRAFGITRDPDGNAIGGNPQVIAQRDALAARTVGHMRNGADPISASKRAAVELFGSANFGDPNHFNQPTDPWIGAAQPLSARNVNPDGLAPVAQPQAQSGGSPLAAALIGSLLGIDMQPAQTVVAPAAPAQPAPTKTIRVPQDTTFQPKPSNEELKQRKVNESRAAEIRQRVAQIESNIRSGTVAKPTAPPGYTSQFDQRFWASVPATNDDHNAMLKARQALLDELSKLEGSSGDSSGVPAGVRAYLPR